MWNLCFNNQFGTFKKTFTKLMVLFDKYIIPFYVYRERKNNVRHDILAT